MKNLITNSLVKVAIVSLVGLSFGCSVSVSVTDNSLPSEIVEEALRKPNEYGVLGLQSTTAQGHDFTVIIGGDLLNATESNGYKLKPMWVERANHEPIL